MPDDLICLRNGDTDPIYVFLLLSPSVISQFEDNPHFMITHSCRTFEVII
jgi:hypothetical protein